MVRLRPEGAPLYGFSVWTWPMFSALRQSPVLGGRVGLGARAEGLTSRGRLRMVSAAGTPCGVACPPGGRVGYGGLRGGLGARQRLRVGLAVVTMGGDLVPQPVTDAETVTAPDDASRVREAADWEWARQQARSMPRWSDEKWRHMNALLRVKIADGGG